MICHEAHKFIARSLIIYMHVCHDKIQIHHHILEVIAVYIIHILYLQCLFKPS